MTIPGSSGECPVKQHTNLLKCQEKNELACLIGQDNQDQPHFSADHLFSLYASKCTFSISKVAFNEYIKLLYVEKNVIYFKEVLQLPLPKNINTWKKCELIEAFEFIDLSMTLENGKPMTVPMMKEKLFSHILSNSADKERLDSFLSKGEKPHEINYSIVQKIVWLNKNPKDWCPSPYQVQNMYGRCLLTALLFSIPEYFPPKADLVKFGYKLDSGDITFNLTPSLDKEKNVHKLLSGQSKKNSKGGKRKVKQTQEINKKKRKPNLPENLID